MTGLVGGTLLVGGLGPGPPGPPLNPAMVPHRHAIGHLLSQLMQFISKYFLRALLGFEVIRCLRTRSGRTLVPSR